MSGGAGTGTVATSAGKTFAQMEARIVEEMHRDDIGTVADDFINDAISHYERYRFWFNETSGTQDTVAGTATYAWPADFLQLDDLVITVSGVKYRLRQVAPRDIDEMVTNSTLTGQPTCFATYAQQFRLYPTPDAIYTLTQYYVKLFPKFTTGANSSNVWTNEAEELIRTRAKKLLYGHFVPAEALPQNTIILLEQHEQNILAGLMRQTQASTATGRTKAYPC